MTDYHTTYKGPEGESTQWDDIQAKLGNKAPKVRWAGLRWAALGRAALSRRAGG